MLIPSCLNAFSFTTEASAVSVADEVTTVTGARQVGAGSVFSAG